MLCFPEDELVTVMMGLAHSINNPTKSTAFHALTMYTFAETLLKGLKPVSEEYCSENLSSSLSFINSKLVSAINNCSEVNQYFSTTCVCSTTAPAAREEVDKNAADREKCLVCRARKNSQAVEP